MGDGKFGSAFAQEDGHAFKEESSGNNERIGQYSYIDDTGKTITVKYSAGVNGFRLDIRLNSINTLRGPFIQPLKLSTQFSGIVWSNSLI